MRGFQKYKPKNPVHLESDPDDAMNQPIELSVWLPYLLGVLGALAVHSSGSTKPRAHSPKSGETERARLDVPQMARRRGFWPTRLRAG